MKFRITILILSIIICTTAAFGQSLPVEAVLLSSDLPQEVTNTPAVMAEAKSARELRRTKGRTGIAKVQHEPSLASV